MCYTCQRTTASELHDSTEKCDELPSTSSSSSLSVEVSARNEDVTERMVCWDLDQRGDVGETALHLSLLLSKQPKFREIAVALLNAFPQLSVDYYEDDEYYGRDRCYEDDEYYGRSRCNCLKYSPFNNESASTDTDSH